MIKLHPVTSSNIAAIGYDPQKRTLFVRFKSHDTYEYQDIDPDIPTALLAAPSVGAAFSQLVLAAGNRGIKLAEDNTDVEPEPDPEDQHAAPPIEPGQEEQEDAP